MIYVRHVFFHIACTLSILFEISLRSSFTGSSRTASIERVLDPCIFCKQVEARQWMTQLLKLYTIILTIVTVVASGPLAHQDQAFQP